MRRIKTSELRVGMILAEPAVDQKGRVLLGKGEKMTDALIVRLKNYNVAEVVTTDPGAGVSPATTALESASADAVDELQKMRADLEIRFSAFKNNPIMNTVRHAAEKVLVSRMKGAS